MSAADEKRRYVPSVAEKIAWTTGFPVPTDKHVLSMLSTFGNFLTGEDCRPRLAKLVARANLPRRTVQRALQRLEADGWVTSTRWHRHPTSYQINVDRLATHPTGAKVTLDIAGGKPTSDENLCATSGAQESDLSATSGAQEPDLSATGGAQEFRFATVNPLLSATSGAPISTYVPHKEEQISIPDLISRTSAPPLRAGRPANGEDEEAKVEVPDWGDVEVRRHDSRQPTAADADLRAERGDHPDDAAVGARGPGGDQMPPSGAGLQLEQRPDSPGAASRDGDRRAPLGPAQPTLGPLDMNPRPSHWQRLVHTIRTALTDATRRKSG